MFSLMISDYQIIVAMLILYIVLGIASYFVTIKTRAIPNSHLRHQVNAWWLIFPIVTVSLLLYPLGPLLLAFVIGILAIRELTPYQNYSEWYFKLFCAGILTALLLLSWYSPQSVWPILAVLIAAKFAHFLCRKQANRLVQLLFLFTCFGISFIVQLAHLPLSPETNLAWLFYLFVMTALNDIGQFVAGKSFGKHKISERISPNKTWQGLAGGLLISLVVSLALGSYLQLANSKLLFFFAILLSLGGFAGDMIFSAAKRFLCLKDFSRLIPGHGGILDRVDSLVITAPLLYFAVYFSRQG